MPCSGSPRGAAGAPLLPADGIGHAGGDAGCAYAVRCPIAVARCRTEAPRLRPVGAADEDRRAACHRADEVAASAPPVQ